MQTQASYSPLTVYQKQPLNAGAPLDTLRRAFLTPRECFFIRCHGSLPEINADTYRVQVTGQVENELALSIEDLRLSFQEHTVTATLQCAGSRRDELAAVRPIPGEVLWGPDAISTAEWRGVLLRDVLQAAGVKAGARYVAFTGLDTTQKEGKEIHFGGSIELDKAQSSEVLLAYSLNDAPLAPAHGFPLRAIVPGYIGARSVKWLQEIIVQDQPSTNYFQAHEYKTFPPEVTMENANWEQGKTLEENELNAAICQPRPGELLKAGPISIQGYALTGQQTPIERVEVSVDRGKTWQEAAITAHADIWAWCLWETTVNLPPGDHQLIARAWDSAGHTQPEQLKPLWNFKGYANHAWHRVNIQIM